MSSHNLIQKKLKYALCLKQSGDYLAAEEELQEGLRIDPENILLLTSLADLYSRENRPEEALAIAEEVLAREPDNQQALIIKGDISLKKKKYEEALDYFGNALRTGATPYLKKRFAQTLMKKGDYPRAMEFCSQILLEEPENPVFMKFLAACYKKLKNHKEAVELYEKLIEKFPGDKFIYKEYIELKAVDRSPEEIIKELEAMVKVSSASENIHLRVLLASTLKKAGRFKEEIEHYKFCLNYSTDDLYVLKQLGFCYGKMGEPYSAINVLRKAFLRDPLDYYVRSSLMSAFQETGEFEDFVKLIDEAIKNHPKEKALWGFKRKILKKL